MRANFEKISEGKRPGLISIGSLTVEQLQAINANRAAEKLPPIAAEVVFVGRHIYQGRVLTDGYTIEDVLDQICSAMDECAVVVKTLKMTGMENPDSRADRYGNRVNDRAIFECTARHPRPELFSVIPKGDLKKPHK